MLHLLPIRLALTAVIILVGTLALVAAYAGIIASGDTLADVQAIVRWSSPLAIGLLALAYATWRWIPLFQRMIFPYLGGEWVGNLQFDGPRGEGVRDISLDVDHNLFNITLILNSDESSSRTLVVHAEHDSGVKCDRLYYVYSNERKEGLPGAGDRYRGLAVLRIESADRIRLYGDYFTEHYSRGRFNLIRKRVHPWWAVWK